MSDRPQQNSTPTGNSGIEPVKIVTTPIEVQSAQQVAAQTVTYAEKTNRIQALTQLIKAVTPLIWAIVILIVIIPLLGRFLIVSSNLTNPDKIASKPDTTIVVESRPDLSELNQAVIAAMNQAHVTAEAFAVKELDAWEEELIPRVDNFLDWYFDYFNQKKLELKAPLVWVSSAIAHKFNPNNTPANQAVAEKLTEDFQREFAKRVLVPRTAQMKFELLTTDTINLYIAQLGNNIKQVQSSYKIPQAQWERYLNDISTSIHDTEGNISTLSLKLLVGGSTYLVAKPIIAVFAGKIGSKITAKLAGNAAAKMAAKTGGAVATQLGVNLIDPIVGVGILIWDVWDYHHTVQVERPILRQNILAYLKDVEKSLLHHPENGIMAAIAQLESGILKSVQLANH
jgi:hypothetical protein